MNIEVKNILFPLLIRTNKFKRGIVFFRAANNKNCKITSYLYIGIYNTETVRADDLKFLPARPRSREHQLRESQA